jgi:hypothetical protein
MTGGSHVDWHILDVISPVNVSSEETAFYKSNKSFYNVGASIKIKWMCNCYVIFTEEKYIKIIRNLYELCYELL